MKTTPKSRKRAKAAPPVSVAQTTGTAAPAPFPAPATAPELAQAERLLEEVTQGVDRLTSPTAELHRAIGKQTLQLLAMVAPKLIATAHAARKAWRKPDPDSKRRAKALAKRWGV